MVTKNLNRYCLPLKENKLFLTESELHYIVKAGVEKLLLESQESDSQKLAIRYIMQNFKWDKERADYFVRKTLRDRITPLRNKRIAKFTLAVTRMWFNGDLDDDNTVSSFNATLPLLSAHLDEYDKDLNGMSATDLIRQFAQARQTNIDNERAEVDAMDFSKSSDYEIVRIDSFEQAQEYYHYTNPSSRWCLTHMENMYDNYTNNGVNQMYFCLKNGFENIQPIVGENAPLDEYGLSMLSIIVDESGGLAYCTTRWNHENGGDDDAMNAKQISRVVGVNFYQTFKPNTKWKEITEHLEQMLASPLPLKEIFDKVSTPGEYGITPVYYEKRGNYVTKDRKILSQKWFDNIQQFSNGVGEVYLGSRYNFILPDGRMVSDKWFDWVQSFINGYSLVGMEEGGKIYLNFIDTNGKYVSKQNFKKAKSFSPDGYAPVSVDGKEWNIIDREGNMVLQQSFDEIESIYNGRCAVSNKNFSLDGDYYYLLDVQTGRFLNEEPYGKLEYEGFGLYKVSNNASTRFYFINNDAQRINDDIYDAASKTFESKGVSSVRIGNKHNLLKPDGTYVSDIWFDAMANIRGTKCFTVYLGTEGCNVIDLTGKLLSPVWFTDAGERHINYGRDVCRIYNGRDGNVWAFKSTETGGIIVPANQADFL